MTPIYHITHLENLQRIIATNGLWCDRERISQGFGNVGIGHQSLKERRLVWPVNASTGGSIGDYVPFYFCNRSPMLYSIKTGQVEGCSATQDDIVYLISNVETISKGNRPWCFTDGHAVEKLTKFFEVLADLDKLDWTVIESWSWKNTERDPDRKRRKQAEFLVRGSVPWNWIEQIGTRTQAVQAKIRELLENVDHRPLVSIQPKWYYN